MMASPDNPRSMGRHRSNPAGSQTIKLTKQQLAAAKTKLRKFYQIKRTITTEEVRATLEMIHRKRGDYDDMMGALVATLSTGTHPIDIA